MPLIHSITETAARFFRQRDYTNAAAIYAKNEAFLQHNLTRAYVLKYAEKAFFLLVFLTARGQESNFERQDFND